MCLSTNIFLWVSSKDSNPSWHWAWVTKALLLGGYGHALKFRFLWGRELDGKKIHQNVQKHHSGVYSKIKTLRQQITKLIGQLTN